MLARCAACGFENALDEMFCGGCGAALGRPSDEKSADRSTLAYPERRHITVLFADMVGSTALAQQLDPEEWREVIQDFQHACTAVVERYTGHVAQYLGDGIMAYFGYPQAHEDDAERAVRAGLGIVERVSLLDAPVRLAVRVGIDTGLVVIGHTGDGDPSEPTVAVGETPNFAALLQSIAEPNAVVIGERTAGLISPAFECEDLGHRQLKGIAEPAHIRRVRGVRRAATRFEAAHPSQLTPLVGRRSELAILSDRWHRAKDGDGQVILLSGPPGVGKSRLVHAFHEGTAREPHYRLLYQCLPYYSQSAFYPIIEEIERAANLDPHGSAEYKLDKLESLLAEARLRAPEVAPLIATLLSIPAGSRYTPLRLTPQQIKDRTMTALAERLLGLADREPVLCVLEDAQWIDPSTLEFVDLSISRLIDARVLFVITYRPEFRPPWGRHGHVTALSLARLARREEAAMVAHVAGGKSLPEEILAKVLAKTDGIPLFVEELTKSIVESGMLKDTGTSYALVQPSAPLLIPATLRNSMTARIDRFPEGREVAQVAAVIDHDISFDLLAAVSQVSDSLLRSTLSLLEDAEVLYRLGEPPHAHYTFKHALVRDAAYDSLLTSKRRELHKQVAAVLEERFTEAVSNQPELLAYHYSHGGMPESAVGYWLQAGRRALDRSAHLEAIAHLRKALETLSQLPETPERSRRELEVELTLGIPLIAVRGYAAQETREAFARARALCAKVGDSSEFQALFGLWGHHWMRAEHDQALALANEILEKAQSQSDPVPVLVAHRVLGSTKFTMGEFASAREHLETTIALAANAPRQPLSSLYVVEPRIAALLILSWDLWFLGYPDQALDKVERALTAAEELAHPYTLAFAHYVVSAVRQLRGEPDHAYAQAEQSLAISQEQRFRFSLYAAFSRFGRGCALVDRGQIAEGLIDIKEGIAEAQRTDHGYMRPMTLGWLAYAYARAGRIDEALSTVNDALQHVDHVTGRAWQAELYRLKGEFLLALSPQQSTAAEASFLQAIAVAREQQAKSLELRAATSLARLWAAQGKRAEARDLLAPVHRWFSEGFETTDLKNAKAFLDS